ncbi:helix-turn-helix domain-containing protein [Streptomyces sp. 3MP-14]|uniref:Helix-turn-helix domain-containing protein n=1 Tax=Streptomyces mimosae TaxID=2586635 RepID=A0A5N6AGS4_9ACTN|nr:MULTISPECIES: helix-turn-helix transcriptional regulator [Streptomyces]KAB8167040.1 helix-turn-helix domain-containing protein [Streptomyces mimosae]KAB8176981.1 helix-turn-helix domain-containing protein [Streptomyces sp. 3MP-14]
MTSNFRLHAARLNEAAAAMGDHSGYAIAKRTGISQSTLSRLRRGQARPASTTLLLLAAAYGTSVEDLVLEAEEKAGAAA